MPLVYQITLCIITVMLIGAISISIAVMGTSELEGFENLIWHVKNNEWNDIEFDIEQIKASKKYTPYEKAKLIEERK
jgi:hypothetical protein